MIQRKALVVLLALATACTIPQTSETKEDTVAVLSEDTLVVATDIDEIPVVDTIYNVITVEQKFEDAQLDGMIGYVYNKEGLDVFSSSKATDTIGHITYKQKVRLLAGHLGKLVAIEFEGKAAYVPGGWILYLPVPETDDVVKYFTANLLLTEDPVERRSKDDDQEGSFSLIDYEFESGFKIVTASRYESGYTNVSLPALNVREAFLFASYFYEDFALFKEFPVEGRDEDLPEERHVTVTVENGEVTVISVGNGSGCYWESSVSGMENGGAVMTTGGGC